MDIVLPFFNYVPKSTYHIVASTSPSRLESHAGLSRLPMKGIFDAYVLGAFDKKNYSLN